MRQVDDGRLASPPSPLMNRAPSGLGPAGECQLSRDPPCRVCGIDRVFIWEEAAPEKAICAECCPHPEYEYERGEGHRCVQCYADAPASYFEGWFDE
jgi:hypothetical protein